MRTLLKCVVAIVALAAMTLFALTFVPASVIYELDATYQNAPDSDDKLRNWVIAQPNVVEHTVHINRRDNQKLEVIAIVCQNSWNARPFIELDRKCAELGYELAGPFAISP